MRCRTFPEPVGPRILLLESVDYFRTSKHFNGRKKVNYQNFDGEANWFGCCKHSLYGNESFGEHAVYFWLFGNDVISSESRSLTFM